MSDLIVYSRRKKVGWSFLPDDILEQVVARILFPEVFQLRCVCKRWKTFVDTQFQERALHGAVRWGPFYLHHVGWDVTRSPVVKWSGFDLSETTMPEIKMPHLEFPNWARGPRRARKTYWGLIGASGGLLCFGDWGLGDRRRVLVCNPMTKAWRELPDSTLDYRMHWFCGATWSIINHMVVDVCRNSYKMLIAGQKGVEVYDSVLNSWTVVEILSPETWFQSKAYINGEVYLLGASFPFVVMILELATLTWRESRIPMPASSLKYPKIVALCDVVYLVGGCSDRGSFESILLYRLESGGSWTRVSAFSYDAGNIYGCGAHGGQIFVATYSGVVAYTCATGVWEKRVNERYKRNAYLTKFAFEPNLVAVP